MSNSPSKIKILPIIVVVLCLSVALLSGTGRLDASYSSGSTQEDSARVARFAVSVGNLSKDNLGTIRGNESASYKFTVSNVKGGQICEVSMGYNVIVTLPDTIEGTELTLKNGEAEPVTPIISEDGLVYTFNDMGSFTANTEKTDTLTLTFTTSTSPKKVKLENVKITVDAVQR